MRNIIDIHAHIFPEKVAKKAVNNIGNHYTINMQGNGIVSDLIHSANESGVKYVVIHSPATKAIQVRHVNSWIAEHSVGNLIGFGTLHPDMENAEEEFERIISLGLKGIKIHPDFQGFNADDPKMDKIYSLIGDRLPILIHAGDEKLDGSSPKRIANILDKFPKLTLIAAHLGGYKNWQESMKYLVGRNLYMDTSSAIEYMDSAFSERIIKKHGINKIVFGTDYPAVYYKEALMFFDKIALSESEREDILYNNAARILGIS